MVYIYIMHHYSIRPFYHIKATANAKTCDGITLQVQWSKSTDGKRKKLVGKVMHDGLTMLCKSFP